MCGKQRLQIVVYRFHLQSVQNDDSGTLLVLLHRGLIPRIQHELRVEIAICVISAAQVSERNKNNA